MDIQDFLNEHKTNEMGYEKLKELKEKYKNNEKLKVLLDMFNYDFDAVNIIKHYGVDFSWEGESFNILKELFGDYAELVKFAWDFKQDYIYHYSYHRRSFRAPNNKLLLLNSKIDFLRSLIYGLDYAFDILDYVKYAYATGYYSRNLSFLFATSVIKQGREDVYQLMLDIIYGRSNEGKIDSSIIKSLLLLDRDESREAIEDLLLSAQRQEGLRQTILEVLDEAHPNNLKYILSVILDNNLTRFSSVVRAFDVWTGLGFVEPRKETIQRGVELAVKYLNDADVINATDNGINKLVEIKDGFEVYMALWASGVNDIEKTSNIIDILLEKTNIAGKMTTLYFINEAEIDFNEKIKNNLGSDNLTLAYLTLRSIKLPKYLDNFDNVGNYDKNISKKIGDLDVSYSKKDIKNLKELILDLFKRTDKKPKVEESVVFSWFNLAIDRSHAMDKLLSLSGIFNDYDDLIEYFSSMNSDQRSIFASSYLNESRWNWQNESSDEKNKDLTAKQQKFTLEALADRSEYVRDIAMRSLKRVKELGKNEILGIEKLLKRKSASLREGVLKLLATQKDKDFLDSARRLIKGSTAEERTAGLDILLILKNKSLFEDEIKEIIYDFKERKRITLKEKNLLNILEGKTGETYSLENGFGIFDPDNLTKGSTPKIATPYWKENNIIKNKDLKKYQNSKYDEDKSQWFKYSIPFGEVMEELKSLDNLIEKHKDVEYECEGYNGSKETVILGNNLRTKKFYGYGNIPKDSEEKYKDLILFDIWVDWFENSKLTSYDLELISLTLNHYGTVFDNNDWLDKISCEHIPGFFCYSVLNEKFNFPNQLTFLLEMFNTLYSFENRAQLILTSYENLLASIPDDKLNEAIPRDYGEDIYWQDLSVIGFWKNQLTFKDKLNKDQIAKLWKLHKWRYESSDSKHPRYLPALLTYAMAYEEGVVSKDDISHSLFITNYLSDISSKPSIYQTFKITERYPFLKDLSLPVIDKILEIELKRGDSQTNVSNLIQNINRVEGSDRFFKVLLGIDKENFTRGYYYYNTNNTKKDNFSKILRVLYPSDKDTHKDFKKQFEESGVSIERLIEAGLYSPQWLEFVAFALGWTKFVSASWWLHTHTSDYKDEQKQSEIGKYTKIGMSDFQEGAVDVDWFYDCYDELGEERWKVLYDGAKYISTGNGHRRAQIFADALTGTLKEKDIKLKINSKSRDKDYLKALGLLPLPKKSNSKEKTVLKRYKMIQKFLKESKQFGSQRQESEKLASGIAIDNLSRAAGFSDTINFKWIMEGKLSDDIIKRAKTVKIDEYEISLDISPLGEIAIKTIKGNKQLKNIPAKLRKDPNIINLKEAVKELKDQNKRTKEDLEQTMINANSFSLSELESLMKHPVVGPLIKKLVIKVKVPDNNKNNNNYNNNINKNNLFGFYEDNNKLKTFDYQAKLIDIPPDSQIMIAHSLDLYDNGLLSDYQKYVFDNSLIQPFKQIFREIYILTPDEKKEKSISRRFAGNQIQIKVALSLFKSRGWSIDYEEGLKKLFRKHGYMAKVFALADWFSPADVESPTIETIEFSSIEDYKNVPFDKVDRIDFSETMRDLDLVVSVAHAGDVDPEASHSTIEMRQALIKETARLLAVDNISLKKNHVMIDGALSTYSLHLGSGVVHKQPGGYISILPVHSQSRGKIFLPFADNDLKTAEIISKMLLLAEDDKIEDPTILKQITTK